MTNLGRRILRRKTRDRLMKGGRGGDMRIRLIGIWVWVKERKGEQCQEKEWAKKECAMQVQIVFVPSVQFA
jgi:hypothetical protein